jgi:hypothetical protein
LAVVATLSKGYDVDYIWKQVDRGPAKDAASYYIRSSESGGEPPGRWWGPGARALGFEDGQRVERQPYDLLFGERRAPDGIPLGRSPASGRKAADLYVKLLAAEPHATAERKRELRTEAARQARQSPLFFDLTISLSKSISIFHASLGENARLASPAVFADAAGRPSLEPDPVLDLDGATVERRWARPATWSGWHAASRLPKPDEVCAIAGSTYRITGPAGTLRKLAGRLPREGAGLRRAEGFGDIRIAREPWRPPAPAAPGQAPDAADAAVTAWLADLRDLALDPPQLRWVADALRELQLARERRAATDGGQDTVTDLLGRAAAGGFSGRQREQLRALFTEPDPRQLRDLTTLVLAEQPASGEGEGR